MNSAQLTDLLTPVVADCDLEIEAVEVVPAGRRRVVRVTVDGDGPKGTGPTLDEIAEATKAISAALDQSDVTGTAPYTLEVSTRGVNRPLERAAPWRRNRGRLVAVNLTTGEQLTGRIVAVDEPLVRLDVSGTERELDLGEVSKASVQIEFNRPAAVDDALDDDSESEDN
jgi:ribosome maturation factor RimP